MPQRAWVACALLMAGCLGPTGHPVTVPIPSGTTVQLHVRQDTVLLVRFDLDSTGDATVPCTARRVDGTLTRLQGDTAWMRTVSVIEPVRAGVLACQRRGGAMVIAPAASMTFERLEPVSLPVQVGGSLLMIGAVAGASLLIFNAVDGLLGIVGRWF